MPDLLEHENGTAQWLHSHSITTGAGRPAGDDRNIDMDWDDLDDDFVRRAVGRGEDADRGIPARALLDEREADTL